MFQYSSGIVYEPAIANISGCGFFFPFPVPPDGVLCSMKIAAMLARSKGRDFYDLMFLLAQAEPDYDFLAKRCGIGNLREFKEATNERMKTIDLKIKAHFLRQLADTAGEDLLSGLKRTSFAVARLGSIDLQ